MKMRIHKSGPIRKYRRGFSILELLVALMVMAMALSTFYFVLDNMRILYARQQSRHRALRQIDIADMFLQRMVGSSSLITCTDDQLIWETYLPVHTLNAENARLLWQRWKLSLHRIQSGNKVSYILDRSRYKDGGFTELSSMKLFFYMKEPYGNQINHMEKRKNWIGYSARKRPAMIRLHWQCRESANHIRIVELFYYVVRAPDKQKQVLHRMYPMRYYTNPNEQDTMIDRYQRYVQ